MAELKGIDALLRRLEKMGADSSRELRAAVFQETLVVQRDSMEHTPVQYGVLRASHETSLVADGAEVAGKIRVGGPAAGYAAHVHENLEARHKVGEAKFLENAVRRAVPRFAARVANRLRAALSGGA